MKNFPPEEIPDINKQIPIEEQNKALSEYDVLIKNVLGKVKEKKGENWQKWFYVDRLEPYRDLLEKAGYSDSDRSRTLAYHPLWNSGPTSEYIYKIDFPGELSVKSFLEKIEAELDLIN